MMLHPWPGIVFVIIYSLTASSSSLTSIDSIYLDLLRQNISDVVSLNNFYRTILQDVKYHRSIDIVSSPINKSKIRSNDYNEEYLRTSCYETTLDLLYAHGFDQNVVQLSVADVQSLLPAILYSIENPGCNRKLPPSKPYSYFDVWILGIIIIVVIKLIYLLIFAFAGDHCLSLTSNGLSKTLSDQKTSEENPTVIIQSPSLKYRLWLGLGFNAFTCGLMLGTIVYHIIPHIYEVPNENFDYIYLLRASVVFFGIYLFFIVEKLLRFRFKIDEVQSEETNNDGEELRKLSDPSMIQMARMHGTLHVSGDDAHPHRHSSAPARIPLRPDSDDDEADVQSNRVPLTSEVNSSHSRPHGLPHRRRNLVLYHIINDFSNDLVYGCGLSTALAHDRLIGSVLSLMIFSEGFRRHSQTIAAIGRRRGLILLFVSFSFLLLGYVIGGLLIEMNRRFDNNVLYIRTEYVYSIVYGALFYTALVTLIPELNDFGHHLQLTLKQTDQTSKQRRLIKILILLCQNLFLIIGVIIALVLAFIWRYYHRISIYGYVCSRDVTRLFCAQEWKLN